MAGTTRYYDGGIGESWDVTLQSGAGVVAIVHAASGRELARWPVAEIELVGDLETEPFHRLRRRGVRNARLVIEDAGLRASVAKLDPRLAGLVQPERTQPSRLLMWAASLVILVGLAWQIVERAPEYVAPLMPQSFQVAIGEDVYRQFTAGSRECRSPEGLAALKRITEPLAAASGYAHPIRVTVVSSPMVNAFALPGGRVVVFSKLIDEASGPHELAAVLAHEFGHLVKYHSMRALVRHFGTDQLLKIVTGGVSGGVGNVIDAAELLLILRHGREAEREADAVGLELLAKAGWRQDGLATFFGRMMKDAGGDSAKRAGIFSTHPPTEERIKVTTRPPTGAMPLNDVEWKALKAICR